MPYHEWPDIDRGLWERAIEEACFLEEPGRAANWSPTTAKTWKKAYGEWLQFLHKRDLLDATAMPADRLKKALIGEWHQELRIRVSPVTILGRFRGLLTMIQALQPDRKHPYLEGLLRRIKRVAKPSRNKHAKLVHPTQILKVTMPLLEELQNNHRNIGRKKLCKYRDALALTVMTLVPVRLKNHANMRIGRNLIRNGDHFDIEYNSAETKTGRPYSGVLPTFLTDVLNRYISDVRPRLIGRKEQDTGHLWVSYRFGALSAQTLYISIVKLSTELLDKQVTPHLLRDTAANWFALEDPEKVRAAAAVLGHTSLATTEKHYNQARMLEAVRQFQNRIG